MNGVAMRGPPQQPQVPQKLRNLDIVLDNPSAIFRPGDKISGTATLELMEESPVYGVRLWIYGTGDTMWDEVKGSSRGGRFQYERYIKELITLYGKPPDNRNPLVEFKLVAGQHSYKFEYQLPHTLPSSFEMPHGGLGQGRVHYHMKLQVDSPNRAVNQTKEVNFRVLGHLDLRKDRHVLQGPVEMSGEKTLGCLCCIAGTIICCARLDKNGYVPGETMHIDIEIINNSSADIITSSVTFEQHTTLFAQAVTRSVSSCIFSISGATIKPGDTGMYHDVIHIPPLPPSRLDGCRLVDIEYMIHVRIEPSGMYSNFELDIPVIIGTEPLEGSFRYVSEVIPCYASFNFSTGDICEYETTNPEGATSPAYVYYKTIHITELPSDISR
ncbi:arrestin domain-containing protein 3-like isoform X2 [Lineus longissimus]|uniref:arrestin domain-containing protein 3-like isoform X2 n=1 Tax=Lineus longissimus TaxID=88925 RepID=UPI002B4E3B7E